MNENANGIVCSDIGQTIKREPVACKIPARASECETSRSSVSVTNQDVVGVTNYQGARPSTSAVTNNYHLIGDKCVQTEVTVTNSYLQAGGDRRTMTVGSNYQHNLNGNNERPLSSTNTTYLHANSSAGRATEIQASTSYHSRSSNNASNNIATSSYQHNVTSGSSGGGTTGGTATLTNGSVNYQEGIGSSSVCSSYHLHPGGGMVTGNGTTVGQVNAPPGYYYSPILNPQQPLLRPIMAAQPPLYSPLLTPQQHSYPMPHASPSAGSAYLASLTESMRGNLADMLPSTSENAYKDTSQSERQSSSSGQAGKSCDSADPRQFAVEMCQRRLQTDAGFNPPSYPSCGEVVRSSHDQRNFDEYSRMNSFPEDGSSRNWDAMGNCGTGTCANRSSGTAPPPNHMTHPYPYSYTDCRIDVAWNKCVAGVGGTPSASGDNFHSQNHQLESNQIKAVARGPASHTTVTVNMNMGASSADPSMTRSHYEYQALSGAQIPTFLPYLTPLNYQQVTENHLEARNEQRLGSNRSNSQLCENQVSASSVRQAEQAVSSGDIKLPSHPPLPHPQSQAATTNSTATTSYAHTSVQTNLVTSTSTGGINHQKCLQQHKHSSANQMQPCGHGVYKRESSEEDAVNKCQACEVCCITESHLSSLTSAASLRLPCAIEVNEARKELPTTSHKKKVSDELSNDNNSCLVCDSVISSSEGQHESGRNSDATMSTASCSVDSLVTVVSKVSVSEKLGLVLGMTLPRHSLHSTAICSKCFQLINELDVMEHRLSHYRKYIISKIEATSEKYGTRLSMYRREQHQQQHHHQQLQHSQQHYQLQQQQQLNQTHHHQEQMMSQYPSLETHLQSIHQVLQQQEHESHSMNTHQLQSLQQHPSSVSQQQQLQQHINHHTVNQMQEQQPTQQQLFITQQQHHNQQLQQHQQPQQQSQPQQQTQQPPPTSQAPQLPQQQAHPQQHSQIHQQPQQHMLTYQHQQQKSQPGNEVISNNTQHETQTQHVPPPQQASVNKPSNNDGSNMVFVDCDIDIEDCECNLMTESQTAAKDSTSEEYKESVSVAIPSSGNCNRTNSECVDINTIPGEPPTLKENPGTSLKTSDSATGKDKSVCHIDSQQSDQKQASLEQQQDEISDVQVTIVRDETRKVEDATEYHKPTLLIRNVKAKKHAKLQICRQCDQVFSNRQALVRHIERRHKAYAFHFSCDTCHKKFSSERALTRHVQLHKTYQCKLCDNIFLRKTKLKKHLENHAQESLNCKLCSKECTSLQALISHRKTHTQKKTVSKCDVCGKTFANNRNLKQHSRTHTGDKPFGCDNCSRRFNHRSNMLAHYDLCTGHFRYKCQVCQKGFSLESLYQRHVAEHKGQFAYKCSVCDRGFSKASGLQAHLPIHSAQRQTYTCQICNRTFKSKSGFTSHKASHTGEDKYECPVCGKTFVRRSDLRDHLHRHAGNKTHACAVCDATFYFRNNLNHHMRTSHRLLRPYTCKYCDKSFGSRYNFKSHIRIHTGEKPFQCKACGKTFSSKGNYNRHLKCHVTQAVAPIATEID